eukprot:jgi/Tetstr1/463450/TSEL_008343.t1
MAPGRESSTAGVPGTDVRCPFTETSSTDSSSVGGGPSTTATPDGKLTIRDQYKLIPFSVGQRSCPGERLANSEMRVLLSTLLREMSWRPVIPWAGVDLRENYSLTLIPTVSQRLNFSRSPPHPDA